MIKAVKLFLVYVSDQDRALDFYVNKLGFKLVNDAQMDEKNRWIEVAPPDENVSLGLYTPPGQEDRIGKSSQISFKCDDVRATFEQIAKRGVQFTQEPQEAPWGMMAMLTDPDGNLIVLSD